MPSTWAEEEPRADLRAFFRQHRARWCSELLCILPPLLVCVAILLLLTLVLWPFAYWRRRPTRNDFEREGTRSVPHPRTGALIEYGSYGPRKGRPVVGLFGLYSSAALGMDVDVLRRLNLRLVVLGYAGYGLSEPIRRLRLREDTAAAVCAVADDAFGPGARFHLVGISWGAALVCKLAGTLLAKRVLSVGVICASGQDPRWMTEGHLPWRSVDPIVLIYSLLAAMPGIGETMEYLNSSNPDGGFNAAINELRVATKNMYANGYQDRANEFRHDFTRMRRYCTYGVCEQVRAVLRDDPTIDLARIACPAAVFTNVNTDELPDTVAHADISYHIAAQIPDATLFCSDCPYGHVFFGPYWAEVLLCMFGVSPALCKLLGGESLS